tara:strand:- start:1559 stop:2419 length:861 start_codon:yes stop_codon:yes gene_type:complete
MKTTDLVKTATKFIELHTNQSYQESKIEAEEIFMHVLGINKPKMYSNLSISMTEDEEEQISYILDKRKNDIPLSYILKKHLFYKHDFYIDEGVLIPRSETESIIDQILIEGDQLYEEKNKCNFLDVGCGSGCVGITIAIERPNWNVVLSDISAKAMRISKKNSKLLNQNNIKLVCGDWLKPFAVNSFDFIFSNPPYISISDHRVEKSVLHNEPSSAIFSGSDGLDDIKEIIKSSRIILSDRGMLFMENGINQTDKISHLLELNEFTDISIHLDYNDHSRFTSSRKK